ncbi:MAG TPA: phage Gp37/Gp68 family protein [Candidatus Angelobacter sp.]|nr:phage Gp37/Gp68 family protein [Candidatus Angelobacter sp.]
MSQISTIEWTEATWNPVRGCTKISPGCTHCYAETFAERFRGVASHPYEQGFDLRLVPDKLLEPLRWPRPKMVFVNSMSDLFHEDVPTAYIKAVCRVMSASPWNIYQVLTKRSQRMKKLLESDLRSAAEQEHIWWGVSVEDRRYGMPRIEDIRKAPARIRFLSIEPLLADLGELDLTGIKWVIVGGESGAGARPMNESWVISIMEQCQCKDIPFFFKQWGGVRKKQTGRQLLGRTYDDFPQVARSAFPNKSERLHLLTSLTKEFLAVLGNNNSEQLELPIAIETIE